MKKKVLIVSFSFEQEPEAFQVLEDAGFTPVLLAEKDRKGFTEADFAGYWAGLKEKPEGILMGADLPLGKYFARRAEGPEYPPLQTAVHALYIPPGTFLPAPAFCWYCLPESSYRTLRPVLPRPVRWLRIR